MLFTMKTAKNSMLRALNLQTYFKKRPSHGRIFEIGPIRDPPITERIGIMGLK